MTPNDTPDSGDSNSPTQSWDYDHRLRIDLKPPYTLSQGDAVITLGKLDAESIDLMVTDPAYESLEKYRKRGTTTRLKHSKASSNDWFKIFPNGRFPDFFRAVYRVMKRNTHFYLHVDAETMFVVKPMAEAAGFRFWKPLVWDKKHIGMGYHYRCRHEFILFFEKGKRRLKDLAIPDILEVARIANGYPAEKPRKLGEIMIGQSSDPGDWVCDPFMGSASVGDAAISLNRRFFGNDISKTALSIAERRLGGSEWKSSPKRKSSEASAEPRPVTS